MGRQRVRLLAKGEFKGRKLNLSKVAGACRAQHQPSLEKLGVLGQEDQPPPQFQKKTVQKNMKKWRAPG